MLVNGLGAVATAVALAVILAAKFTEGAWITVILIPGMLVTFGGVNRHYRRVARQTACTRPIDLADLEPPIVVVPIEKWNLLTEQALRFGLGISRTVIALHVALDDAKQETLRQQWHHDVEVPARRMGHEPPRLEVVPSPYRRLLRPILDYIDRLKKEHPGRKIAVVIPELVQKRWYEYFLHNHRAEVLKALLLLQDHERIIIVNIPWYMR